MKLIRLLPPLLAVFALLMLLAAGPGTRLGLWDFSFGFTLMRWALYVGLAAAAVALLLAVIPATRRKNLFALGAAFVIGLGVAVIPYLLVQQARSVPRIHDITTDTRNPPAFVAIAPLRANAPNPVEYPGEEVAIEQRQAYPEITTFTTDLYPSIVFDHAEAVVQTLRWELVDSDREAGRIEATDTTTWFGFKDDVVIRIQGSDAGSLVDVRSKSRVGMSDVGANAARIQRFLDALEERVH
ncbi:MAG: DUF1499 domain-containing protein [Wenzhouxiangella sp.]